MKTKIIFFILLYIGLFLQRSYAQTYIPFPDSNAIWSEYHKLSMSGSSPYYCRNILIDKDTIINSKTYHQLFYSLIDTAYNTNVSVFYNGGIRETNKQFFYLPKDSINEYLLYDFSKSVGDTIKYDYSIFAYNPIDSLVVSNIDSIMIEDGTYRKRIILANMGGLIMTYTYWIEGIGNNMGLLFPVADLPTNGSINVLGCFKQNENIVYFNNYYSTFNSCFPIITSNDEIETKNIFFSIYPNPINEYSIIKWEKDSQFSTLEIYNMAGISVLKINVSNFFSFEINDNLNCKGIYLIKLSDNNGKSLTAKLIIL